ncbi:MAG: type II toxin-antitoxin system HicB family antitoxin [Parcubacteria group bacterium]|nr:type II toxin-antitoxin system HicB family antitoxin [Parcubacteria group bacterium]
MIELMKNYKEKIYEYEVMFESNGAGYTITVPKLPGLVTEGDNLKHSREMAKDAIRCYLEAILKEKALPFSNSSTRIREKVDITM